MDSFTTVVAPITIKEEQKIAAAKKALICDRAPVPAVMNGTVNISQLSIEQRHGLLQGPKVDIFVGNNQVFKGAPLRAFMATSAKANTWVRRNPLQTKVVLKGGRTNVKSLKTVLKSTLTTRGIGGKAVIPVPVGKDFKEGLFIYTAGLELGMDSQVKHVANRLCQIASKRVLEYDELTALILYTSPSDAVFQHVAKILANARFKGQITDKEDFNSYLQKHPTLGKAMNDIDAPFKATRKAHADAIAREKQDAKDYQNRVNAILQKLNSAAGGISTLTSEEAELRRELGI